MQPPGRRAKWTQPWAVTSGPWFPLHFRLFRDRIARRLDLSAGQAERSSKVIRPLAVIGNVETFELGLLRCPKADGQVDELVEDQRAETRPAKREKHILRLDCHLRHHV